jgi:hypothetical protein
MGLGSRVVLAALAALVLAFPASSGARVYVAGQMNISTGDRVFDDTSVIQYAAPRTVHAKIQGKTRRVSMSVNTLCCRTDSQLLRDTTEYGGPAVMLDRPLTTAEKRRYTGHLVWVDGDVLVAQPGNPSCAAGMSLTQARGLLKGPGSARVYAPASPFDGARVVMFGIPAKNENDHAYGPGVRIVGEQQAIAAVTGDPGALAAVAWSAARAALDAGAVCQVPINGVTASEATLRSRQYPVSVQATFVVSKKSPFGAPWLRRWYLSYLKSAKVHKLLQTADGRNRLLP